MKLLKQMGILIAVCLLGVVVEALLPFSFPASIISMALLFAALMAGLLKPAQIRQTAEFLLNNMIVLFIPAGVSMMNDFDTLLAAALPIVLICVISTVLTFAATAYTVKFTGWLLRRNHAGKEKHAC